jgi:hypothetical protein
LQSFCDLKQQKPMTKSPSTPGSLAANTPLESERAEPMLCWSDEGSALPPSSRHTQFDGLTRRVESERGRELFIQSDTGTPHPDQFVMNFPGVSSFTWSLLNGGTDKVSEADLYGVDPVVTPLPAALPLFAGGLGLVGMLARRRNKYAVAAAQ